MEQLQTSVIDYENGIYAIDQQMVRAFLIVGSEKAILLDTGAIRADIHGYINKITDLPVEVILTHGDGDHIGNLGEFTDAYLCENDMDAVRSHPHCEQVQLHPLQKGQIIDIGGRRLEVLFTPGHTAGSICLLDRENGILFSGDTVSFGPVFMFEARRNMNQYLQSLQNLQKLRDTGAFDMVFCCHNTCPISAETIDNLISCTYGVLDGSITGVPAAMPIPTNEKPYIAKYGNCALLIKPESE